MKEDFKILVVEDNDYERELLTRIINLLGFKVESISNAQEVLDNFENYKDVKLIISDINLPKLNGIDFIEKIRLKNPDVLVIYVSAYAESIMFDRMIKTEPIGFMYKPLNVEVLKVSIFNAYERYKRVQNEKHLKNLLLQYKEAIDCTTIVSKTDTKGIITYVNDLFCNISKYKKEELIGKPHNIVRHPDMPKEIFRDMWNTIKSGHSWRGIIKNRAKDGSEYIVNTYIQPLKDIDGNITEYISIRHDVTDLIKQKERLQQLTHKLEEEVEKKIQELQKEKMKNQELAKKTEIFKNKSYIDDLTGLFNRRYINDIMSTMDNYCVIIFDIDNFKKINDRYGHLIGDEVLKLVAKIAKENVRTDDIVVRWGGEEFLIIVKWCILKNTAKVAEKIRKAIEETYFPEVQRVTASFGVTCNRENESYLDTFKRADEALYEAKYSGKNKVLYKE